MEGNTTYPSLLAERETCLVELCCISEVAADWKGRRRQVELAE